jgi:hypothetical protein
MRFLGTGGMALKPSDFFTVPLCYECHNREHHNPFMEDILVGIFRTVLGILSEYISTLEEKKDGREFLSQKRGHKSSR